MLCGVIAGRLRLRPLGVKIGEMIPCISKIYFLVCGLAFGRGKRQSKALMRYAGQVEFNIGLKKAGTESIIAAL